MDKSQELQQLTGRVEGLMSKVAGDQSPQLQELRSRAAQTIDSAKTAIAKADSAALDAIRNAASSADDYVRENPWIAIGVIAGVGGIAGFSGRIYRCPAKILHGHAATLVFTRFR